MSTPKIQGNPSTGVYQPQPVQQLAGAPSAVSAPVYSTATAPVAPIKGRPQMAEVGPQGAVGFSAPTAEYHEPFLKHCKASANSEPVKRPGFFKRHFDKLFFGTASASLITLGSLQAAGLLPVLTLGTFAAAGTALTVASAFLGGPFLLGTIGIALGLTYVIGKVSIHYMRRFALNQTMNAQNYERILTKDKQQEIKSTLKRFGSRNEDYNLLIQFFSDPASVNHPESLLRVSDLIGKDYTLAIKRNPNRPNLYDAIVTLKKEYPEEYFGY